MKLKELRTLFEKYNDDEMDVNEVLKGNTEISKLFDKPLTLETVKSFMDNNDAGKQYLQSYGDARVSKGIETWKTNNLDTLINDAVLKATGKKKTPEELKYEELEKRFNEEQAIRIKAENSNKLNNMLIENGLDPKRAAEFFSVDNMENLEKQIGNFKAYMEEGIKSGVQEQIKAGNYTPPGSNGTDGELCVEDLASMMM